MTITLENPLGLSNSKLLSLSNDGKFCVIGAGAKAYFYIIALETQQQFKLTPKNLTKSLAPCFINGASNLVAVGGYTTEGVEIWSVEDKELIHHIENEEDVYVSSLYSANGILAVGYGYSS